MYNDPNMGGHFSAIVTEKRMRSLFYWRRKKTKTFEIVCESVPFVRRTKLKIYFKSLVLLQPLPITSILFTDISMDFMEGLFKSNDKKIIFMVMDKFSKYIYFLTLAHPYSTTTVATIFMYHVYKLHSLPGSIVSDRDSVFLRINFLVFIY
jgi:hypothetical protein